MKMLGKVDLADEDVERIASAVAAKLAKGAAKNGKGSSTGRGKGSAKADDADDGLDGDSGEDGESEDGESEDDFGDGDGDGDGDGEDAPTREDVRDALKSVSKKFSQEVAMALMKKTGGATALSKLKEEKFAAVIAAAKKKVGGK